MRDRSDSLMEKPDGYYSNTEFKLLAVGLTMATIVFLGEVVNVSFARMGAKIRPLRLKPIISIWQRVMKLRDG